jgi:hypothetical protein
MAYQINRYDNTVIAVVQDGTVNSTATDLKFIGKNFVGYGEVQNENFMFLLENFAGANPPPRKVRGQIWFDSTAQKLKFYDGFNWRIVGGSEASPIQPSGLSEGDSWWNSVTKQLFVFDGAEFILIGPQGAGEAITQMRSRQIIDANGNPRNIILGISNGVVVYIVSSEDFFLGQVDAIPGFDRVRKGLTLVDTQNTTNGVTSSDFRYAGTATNSDRLGGVLASQYIRQDNLSFDDNVLFSNDGITIGDNLALRIYIEGNEGIIENQAGLSNAISFKTKDPSGNTVKSLTINSTGLVPPQNNIFNLGSSALRYNEIFAARLVGTADQSNLLRVDGALYRSASTSATNNTVVARDANGVIKAVLFDGVATSSRYADLAEKYTTNADLQVGTVVKVCSSSDHEMCATSHEDDFPAGVVSHKPGFIMNSESSGQAIALVGRVPVRVLGAVKKGDKVYAYKNGLAIAGSFLFQGKHLVGIALETNTHTGEKLVECILKI